MRVSHIIVTMGRPEPLRSALESSIQALSPEDETIVVDGDPEGSARPAFDAAAARHPDAALRYLASAPGTALQRNVGLDTARGQIVVFTDDDCTFRPVLFDQLMEVYEDPAVVGATGRIREPPRPPRLGSDTSSQLRRVILGGGREGAMTSFGFRRPIVDVDRARDVEFMPGPLMSARREIASEVRFDERLTAYGLGEDDDFSYRVSCRGRVRYEPSISVDHNEIGFRSMDRRARDRRQVINRTYLFRKNFAQTPASRIAYCLLIAAMFVHRALNREWDGLRGLADGLAYLWRHGSERPEGQDGSGSAARLPRPAASETSA